MRRAVSIASIEPISPSQTFNIIGRFRSTHRRKRARSLSPIWPFSTRTLGRMARHVISEGNAGYWEAVQIRTSCLTSTSLTATQTMMATLCSPSRDPSLNNPRRCLGIRDRSHLRGEGGLQAVPGSHPSQRHVIALPSPLRGGVEPQFSQVKVDRSPASSIIFHRSGLSWSM
jgi:hypothetical protein